MLSSSQLIGLASFIYSKCVEQGTIREGAAAVKKVIDEEINVKYENVRQDTCDPARARRARARWAPPHPSLPPSRARQHPSKIKYTIGVHAREFKTLHMGRTLLERPVVTIWVLYSPNSAGVMTEWHLPDAITRADTITIRRSRTSIRNLTAEAGPAS